MQKQIKHASGNRYNGLSVAGYRLYISKEAMQTMGNPARVLLFTDHDEYSDELIGNTITIRPVSEELANSFSVSKVASGSGQLGAAMINKIEDGVFYFKKESDEGFKFSRK